VSTLYGRGGGRGKSACLSAVADAFIMSACARHTRDASGAAGVSEGLQGASRCFMGGALSLATSARAAASLFSSSARARSDARAASLASFASFSSTTHLRTTRAHQDSVRRVQLVRGEGRGVSD
jgi:hypothetical protein